MTTTTPTIKSDVFSSLEVLESLTSNKDSLFYYTDEQVEAHVANTLRGFYNQEDEEEEVIDVIDDHDEDASDTINNHNNDDGDNLIIEEEEEQVTWSPSKFMRKIGDKVQCIDCEEYSSSEIEFEHKHYNNPSTKCKECSICHIKFISNVLLRSHIISAHKHLSNDKLICGLCGKTFDVVAEYFRHSMKSHLFLLRQTKCELCDYFWSKDFNLLAKHIQINHHNDNKCGICLMVFYDDDPDWLNKKIEHQKVHHLMQIPPKNPVLSAEPEQPVIVSVVSEAAIETVDENDEQETPSCTICNSTFSTLRSAQLHRQIIHPELNIQNTPEEAASTETSPDYVVIDEDEDGDATINTKNSLSEPPRNSWNCIHCLLNFSTNHNSSYHITKYHLGLRSFEDFNEGQLDNKCYVCDQFFGSQDNMLVHFLCEHGFNETCYICDYKAVDFRNILKHRLVVHQIGFHHCMKCNFSTVSSSKLLLHYAKNSGCDPRSIRCWVCKKIVKGLSEHMATVHPTASLRRQCKKCNILFDSLEAKRQHIEENHSAKIKQSVCDPKRGIDSTVRQRCHICKKLFDDIKNHMSTEHPHVRMKRKCELCGVFCKTLAMKKKHKAEHHSKSLLKRRFLLRSCIHCKDKIRSDMYISHINEKHSSERKLDLERQVEEDPNRANCLICGNVYMNKHFMHMHFYDSHRSQCRLENIANNDQFYCLFCNQAFDTFLSVISHHEKIHGLEYSHCLSCPFTTSSPERLSIHRSFQHSKPQSPKQPTVAIVDKEVENSIVTLDL